MKTRGQIRNVEGRIDISEGKEAHPIPVKCPASIPLPQFEYIKYHCKESAFYIPPDRLQMKGCDCDDGKCYLKKCKCRQQFKKIGEFLECGDECYCSDNCGNRQFKNGVLPLMYLQYGQSTHGFGVFANENIAKGTFVAAYSGEICETKRNTDVVISDYTYTIDSNVSKSEVEIDATKKGNIARFFNHSCKSNLETKIAYFGLYRMPYPVFFAKINIQKDQQLTIDYGENYFSNKDVPCKCGECPRR